MAALRALELFTTRDIAICTESQYVILGATGAARRWKLRGCKGFRGPVPNVSLWEQLLLELDTPGRTVLWVKVPSHVHVEGNKEADTLAEQGRMSHPKFPGLATPVANSLHCSTPKAPKRRKTLTTQLSPSVAVALDPPPPLPVHSADAQAMLTVLELKLPPDRGLATEDATSALAPDSGQRDSHDQLSTDSSDCSRSTNCSCNQTTHHVFCFHFHIVCLKQQPFTVPGLGQRSATLCGPGKMCVVHAVHT